jgi:hypothetical protein
MKNIAALTHCSSTDQQLQHLSVNLSFSLSFSSHQRVFRTRLLISVSVLSGPLAHIDVQNDPAMKSGRAVRVARAILVRQ